MATVAFTSPVSGSRRARYEGVIYDPKTHEILGEASAQYNHNRGSPVGAIKYDGKVFNFENPQRVMSGTRDGHAVNRYAVANRNTDGEIVERMKLFTVAEDAITGYLDRRGDERVAYTVADPRQISYDRLVQHVENTAPGKPRVIDHE